MDNDAFLLGRATAISKSKTYTDTQVKNKTVWDVKLGNESIVNRTTNEATVQVQTADEVLIETTPTSGSTNLLTSGGIYSAFANGTLNVGTANAGKVLKVNSSGYLVLTSE